MVMSKMDPSEIFRNDSVEIARTRKHAPGTFEKKEITIYGDKPWGFTLNGGLTGFPSLIVTKVNETEKAHISGLEAGDIIEAVNGEQCRERKAAVRLIQHSTGVLHLTVVRFPNRSNLVEECLQSEQQNSVFSASSNSANLRVGFKHSVTGVNSRRRAQEQNAFGAHMRQSRSAGDLNTLQEDENPHEDYPVGNNRVNGRHNKPDMYKNKLTQGRISSLTTTEQKSIVAAGDMLRPSNSPQWRHSVAPTKNNSSDLKSDAKTSIGDRLEIDQQKYHVRSRSAYEPPLQSALKYSFTDKKQRQAIEKVEENHSSSSSEDEYDDEFMAPAYSVYPRRHSLGYSLEIVQKSAGSSDVLPTCRVFDSKSPHQILVPEDYLKRRSVIVKSDSPSSLFQQSQSKRNLEKSRSYETFTQFEDQEFQRPNQNYSKTIIQKSNYIENGASVSSYGDPKFVETEKISDRDLNCGPRAPMPPTRRSSMNAVAELTQNGVWSRNTRAVAKLNHINNASNLLTTLKERDYSTDLSLKTRIDNNLKVSEELNDSWIRPDPIITTRNCDLDKANNNYYISTTGASKQNDKSKSEKAFLDSLPDPSLPPPIPARESSRSINIANYASNLVYPEQKINNLSTLNPPSLTNTSDQVEPSSTKISQLPVTKKVIVVDPLNFSKTSPSETARSSLPKKSDYSPFHKPLPSLPPEKSLYARRGSESLLHFTRRSSETEFCSDSPDDPKSEQTKFEQKLDRKVTNAYSERGEKFQSKSVSHCDDSPTGIDQDSKRINVSQSCDQKVFSINANEPSEVPGGRKRIPQPFLSSTPLPGEMELPGQDLEQIVQAQAGISSTSHNNQYFYNRRNYFLSRNAGTVANSGCNSVSDKPPYQTRFLSDPSKLKEASEETVKVRFGNRSDPQPNMVERAVRGGVKGLNDSHVTNESLISSIGPNKSRLLSGDQDSNGGLSFIESSSLEDVNMACIRRTDQDRSSEDFNKKLRMSLALDDLDDIDYGETSVDSENKQPTNSRSNRILQNVSHIPGSQISIERTVLAESSKMALASWNPISNSRFGDFNEKQNSPTGSRRSKTINTIPTRHVNDSSLDSGNGRDVSDGGEIPQIDITTEDDADEHLAGSAQTQFQIARNRFLRKQNDSLRASQSQRSRTSFVSKRDNSLRSKIAKSTENIIRAEKPSSESENHTVIQHDLENTRESLDRSEVKLERAISRRHSKSVADLCEISNVNDLTEDSGVGGLSSFLGSHSSGVQKASADEITSSILMKGSLVDLRGSNWSVWSTVSSEDLSISAAGGLLSSRATSLDNLVAEADREQVQSALNRVGDLLARDRMELASLSGSLLDQSQAECDQIITALQKSGRESDVKRFNRYLESLCTSCKLSVHEETRLHKLDQRLGELSARSRRSLAPPPSQSQPTTPNQDDQLEATNGESEREEEEEEKSQQQQATLQIAVRSQKSMEKDLEYLRRSMDKQRQKVNEAQLALEDAESTLLQHLEKVFKNCPEEVKSSKLTVENRVALTRKKCLCESSIKSNEDFEKYLKKQLIIHVNAQDDETSETNS